MHLTYFHANVGLDLECNLNSLSSYDLLHPPPPSTWCSELWHLALEKTPRSVYRLKTLVDIAEDPSSESTAGPHFSIGDEEASPSASPTKEAGDYRALSDFAEMRRDNAAASTPLAPASGGRLSRQGSLGSLFSDASFQLDSSFHPYQFQVQCQAHEVVLELTKFLRLRLVKSYTPVISFMGNRAWKISLVEK